MALNNEAYEGEKPVFHISVSYLVNDYNFLIDV